MLRYLDNGFKLFLIQLKRVRKTNFKAKEISEKFNTAFNDFMKKRFRSIFLDTKYEIKDLEIYFVKGKLKEGVDNKTRGMEIKIALGAACILIASQC